MNTSWEILGALLGAAVLAGCVVSQPPNPKELGGVAWERDFEQGAARARAAKKPVFLLFQEVPG